MKSRIILASASPRRYDILKDANIDFQVIPSNADETILKDLPPIEVVKDLALKKALSVKDSLINSDEDNHQYRTVIIGADTIVHTDQIFGKPKDKDDGRRILKLIRNRKHLVTTGVAVVLVEENRNIVFSESTEVLVKDISDQELENYLNTDEPYDKAGAYAIQGIFSKYIEGYNGDYFNVVGLPINKLKEILIKEEIL